MYKSYTPQEAIVLKDIIGCEADEQSAFISDLSRCPQPIDYKEVNHHVNEFSLLTGAIHSLDYNVPFGLAQQSVEEVVIQALMDYIAFEFKIVASKAHVKHLKTLGNILSKLYNNAIAL